MDSRRLAPRSGVRPMDGPNNPSLPAKAETRPRGGFFIFGWGTAETNHVTRHFLCLALRAIGCADVRFGILPEQSTSRLERQGQPQAGPRKAGVWLMDGPNNPSLPAKAETRPRGGFLFWLRYWMPTTLLATFPASRSKKVWVRTNSDHTFGRLPVFASEVRFTHEQVAQAFNEGNERGNECPAEEQVHNTPAGLTEIELVGT